MAHVVLAVGDMAGPADQNGGSVDTAILMSKLLVDHPDALVLVLGDNAYNDGGPGEYDTFYKPIWGVEAIASRVRACPGNHDYHTSNAAPYFAHFGWDVLYRHRVEVVLNGHAHHYERFAPQTPKQRPDPAGIREFIVGTGGRGLVPPKPPGRRKPNSETANGDTFGVLKLVLTATTSEWEFVPTPGGGGFADRSAAPQRTNH